MTENSTISKLTQPTQFLKGVGPQRAELLEKLGLRTAADLLFFFPTRYEDFTDQVSIADLEVGQAAQVVGVVDDIDETKKDNQHILYVLLKQGQGTDVAGTGYLRGIWFNQDYMLAKFRFGQIVKFCGKVSERGGRLQMMHPQTTWVDDAQKAENQGFHPIYRLTEGISQRQMRRIVESVVEQQANLVAEAIPEELQQQNQLCTIDEAIRQIHAPRNQTELESARRRLVFQELLILQLALSMRRHNIRIRAVAPELEMTPKIRARMLGRLPFELRPSQLTVFDQIADDMGKAYPMNRLLHGEVGSGKTVVAACAMMLAVANSHQAALMAPTEILANQHFQTLSRLLAGSRVRIELVTGSMTAKRRKEVSESIAAGEVDLVIGTTAVIGAKTGFAKLGLVVIDEQHKFGVRQRALLKQAGFDPHYLVMTATPIPRTITMTLFGDLDVSILESGNEPGANKKTYLGSEDNREKWWQFFRKKLSEGRQGYVVAPFVDNKNDSAIQSAEDMFEGLTNGPLEAFRLGLLHGRQSAEEKLATMQEFANGDIQVLVATGVVEVGIDVPNATVMTIESAERFGLSQLHQLRGRVGRGQHPGYVCAFPTAGQGSEQERLQAFADVQNGFELAQIDLKLRGPGNLLSTKQTGFPPLRIANLIEDEAILVEAQSVARKVIEQDPNLAQPQHARLRQLVTARYSKVLDLSDVG